MNDSHIRNVIEAALLAAGKPLQPAELVELFDEGARPQVQDIQAALTALMAEYSNRGIEIKETAAGFRIQVRREMANEISRLWPERPARYSRALLETLALIAYRQPITRAEIEAVRGVAVNPNILKTVIERNWVRVVGHRDVPGRPELLGTTRDFLDYFGLKNLDDLPPLAELKVIGDIKVQFDLPDPGPVALADDANGAAGAADAAGVEGTAAVAGVEGTAVDVADAVVEVMGAAAEVVDGAAEVANTATQVEGAADSEGAEAVAAGSEGTERAAAGDDGANGLAAASEGTEGAAVGSEGAKGAAAAVTGATQDAVAGDADGTMATSVIAHRVVQDAVGANADGEEEASESGDGLAGAPVTQAQVGLGAEDAAVGNADGVIAATADADLMAEDAVRNGADGEAVARESADGPTGAVAPRTDGPAVPETARKSAGDHKKSSTTRRGAPDSALHEAEEFAASIDADLAAGDDDGSDDDELSAAGPGSSELVAGPRDIDD